MTYDCTIEVQEHRRKVKYWMDNLIHLLTERARLHDLSKLQPPEKQIFDEWTPRLKEFAFGSDDYRAALAAMGEGLQHHYANNRHHPEFFENGVNGMTLLDLVEMYCDWLAAAEKQGRAIDLDYLTERFSLSPQLRQILLNTLHDDDYWNAINGVPVIQFATE